jgi:hypothetical protein
MGIVGEAAGAPEHHAQGQAEKKQDDIAHARSPRSRDLLTREAVIAVMRATKAARFAIRHAELVSRPVFSAMRGDGRRP